MIAVSAETLDQAVYCWSAFAAISLDGHLFSSSRSFSTSLELRTSSGWSQGRAQEVLPAIASIFPTAATAAPPWISPYVSLTATLDPSVLTVRSVGVAGESHGEALRLLMGARGRGVGVVTMRIGPGDVSSTIAFEWQPTQLLIRRAGGCIEMRGVTHLIEAARLVHDYQRLPCDPQGFTRRSYPTAAAAGRVMSTARLRTLHPESVGWRVSQHRRELLFNCATEVGVADAYEQWGAALFSGM